MILWMFSTKGASIDHIDFATKAACEAARTEVYKEPMVNESPYAVCVAKG